MFYVSWEDAEIGILRRDNTKEKKTDFAIQLKCLVEAQSNTGYSCKVKRFQDMEERCII